MTITQQCRYLVNNVSIYSFLYTLYNICIKLGLYEENPEILICREKNGETSLQASLIHFTPSVTTAPISIHIHSMLEPSSLLLFI